MKKILLFTVMGLLLLGCKKSKNSPEINPHTGDGNNPTTQVAFEFGKNASFTKYVLNETGSGTMTLTFQTNVTYKAGSEQFVFKSNIKNWTAENLTNDWLTLSPTSGHKGEYATLSINFTKNGGARREGKIQVSSGDSIFMIVIQQSEPFVFRVGEFSISDKQKVHFSPGNLQYQASSGTWRFAERQFDRCGNGISNGTTQSGKRGTSTVFWEDAGVTKPCDNALFSSSTYGGWIDLFVWGTGNKPTYTGTNTDWSEWGDNPIHEGNTTHPTGTWRTLKWGEWEYLLDTRRNEGDISYTFVRLHYGSNATDTVMGVIIYPDNFSFKTAGVDAISIDPEVEITDINMSIWSSLEKVGAVFLPWADLDKANNEECDYWSKSNTIGNKVYCAQFNMKTHRYYSSYTFVYYRCPVRLVQDITAEEDATNE